MAATGLNRHIQFVENVQLYTKHFRQFIVDIDQADAESLHLIGIPEGMSNKPIDPEQIPIFEDKLTFRDSFNSALVDMARCLFYLPVCFFQEHVFFSYAQQYAPPRLDNLTQSCHLKWDSILPLFPPNSIRTYAILSIARAMKKRSSKKRKWFLDTD